MIKQRLRSSWTFPRIQFIIHTGEKNQMELYAMERYAKEDLQKNPILREIVRRLVNAYQPEKIYLFGSKGRGDEGPDSDYDLMVVVPDQASLERRRSQLAYQVLRGTATAADVLVWTKKYFEDRLSLKASLSATIVREGKLLYAA
jgi:predicted nucleotidyltransferase